MSLENDLQVIDRGPVEDEIAAPPAGNPLGLGLMTFLPAGLTLGLWFVGYLDTTDLPGGMIPICALSAGVFMLIAAVWAASLRANTVAAVLALFSAFWLTFAVLLAGITGGWWGISAAGVANVQRTYLLSFLIVFAFLTAITLRLPIVFTTAFLFVTATFVLAFIGVSSGNTGGMFPIAGVTTFIFVALFAYILADGIRQDLGARPLPMGNPIIR
jgi:hypothetical protein